MGNLKGRLAKLERRIEPQGPPVIIVDWGGDLLTIGDREYSREEAERLYPEAVRLLVVYDSKTGIETTTYSGQLVKRLSGVSMRDL